MPLLSLGNASCSFMAAQYALTSGPPTSTLQGKPGGNDDGNIVDLSDAANDADLPESGDCPLYIYRRDNCIECYHLG